MVHVIYFFKEYMISESGGPLVNGLNDASSGTHTYKGEKVAGFEGMEATPIINWLMKNVEHSRNTYSVYHNPKVSISVYTLIRLLDDIDECLAIDFDGLNWYSLAKINQFFPVNLKSGDATNVPLEDYIPILRRYKKVFEPLVWVDKDTRDYRSSGDWYYTIISEYLI